MNEFIKLDNRMRRLSPSVLRISLSLVFLWFGINQLINPQSFLGYVPQWLVPHSFSITHHHPLELMHNIPKPSVHLLIMSNGLFEVILGLFLLLGVFTRLSSLLLSLHLFFIGISLGYNDIMIRDLGLSLATFSIFLRGPDFLCFDFRCKKIKEDKNEKIMKKINWILLALLMLAYGSIKLFIIKPPGTITLLNNLNFHIPWILAWILIISEIVSGVPILLHWKIEYLRIPIFIVLTVAFTFLSYGSSTLHGNSNIQNILLYPTKHNT